jgi:hypothetical protein
VGYRACGPDWSRSCNARTGPSASTSTLHCLGLDRVYLCNAQGALEFHELATPSTAEVREIARRTARRLHAEFVKQGRKSPWDHEAVADRASLPRKTRFRERLVQFVARSERWPVCAVMTTSLRRAILIP